MDEQVWYSIGGGFIQRGNADDRLVGNHERVTAPSDAGSDDEAAGSDTGESPADTGVPYPFTTCDELIAICRRQGMSIADVVWANETAVRPADEVRERLLTVWRVMRECVANGCSSTEPVLPGGLDVPRRAPGMYARLATNGDILKRDAGRIDIVLESSDAAWVNLFALAVSEENAGGGYLFKRNASISGAEVGCQGEVGVACSMAAAGLAAVLGGTPEQVENAAEIGIEHNLGLTCDPVGGLVQIPCIERNAMGANTAINAVRMAMVGDGSHIVSLDQAIVTMKQTGEDMMAKYKETSKGGLAVNVVEC